MFDKKKLVEAYNAIHASQETVLEVMNMVENEKKSKRGSLRRIAVIVLAAALAVVGTAYAARYYNLIDLISKKEAPDTEFVTNHIESLPEIQQAVEPKLPDALSFVDTSDVMIFTEPLLEVQEVYFDGSKLYVYAIATKAGANYDLFSERMIINGEQYYTEFKSLLSNQHYYQGDDKPESNAPDELRENYEEWKNANHQDVNRYYGEVDLSSKVLADNFVVELPVCVRDRADGLLADYYKDADGHEITVEYRSDGQETKNLDEYPDFTVRYNILTDSDYALLGYQTISFHVSVTDNSAKVCPTQVISLENGMAELKTLTLSPSITHICVKWCFYGENAKTQVEKLSSALLTLEDVSGKAYDWMFDGTTPVEGTPAVTSVYVENGGWCTEKEFYFTAISADTKKLTVIPYGMKDNAMDRTGETLNYAVFTVDIP